MYILEKVQLQANREEVIQISNRGVSKNNYEGGGGGNVRLLPPFGYWLTILAKYNQEEEIYQELESLGMGREELEILSQHKQVSLQGKKLEEYNLRIRPEVILGKETTPALPLEERIKEDLRRDFLQSSSYLQECWDL